MDEQWQIFKQHNPPNRNDPNQKEWYSKKNEPLWLTVEVKENIKSKTRAQKVAKACDKLEDRDFLGTSSKTLKNYEGRKKMIIK